MRWKLCHPFLAMCGLEGLLLLTACGGTAPARPVAASAQATSVTLTGPATLNCGTPAQYQAVVAGTTDQVVSWAINGVAGGNATLGTMAANGLYTPPSNVPADNTIVISAGSALTPGVSAALNATLLNAVPAVALATGTTTDAGLHYLIDVQGFSFAKGATLVLEGQAVATNTISANELQATVADSNAQPMQVGVAVRNPDPGATQSGTVEVSLSFTPVSATAAARFLDQTSFGPTALGIAHVQQIGLQGALAEQFNQPATPYSQPPSPDAECPAGNFRCTQSDFLKVSAFGADQLRQRVAMALSEIWVAPQTHDNAMPFYLNTLSADAFTNYRTIMQDVSLTPQMGAYLNMANSGAPASGQIANENFGREMMQLFTLGPNLLNADGTPQQDANGNTVPTYSEAQVEAFARAYTGWTYANADGSVPAGFNNTQTWNHAMVPVEAQHDQSEKSLLSGAVLPQGQTAAQDLRGAFDSIFAHPNIGPFVARLLIQHLVTGSPSPAYVERVATVFANNGNGVRGDMKAVLTAIVMDPEARAGDAQSGDQAESHPAVDGGHLREPLLWTANLVRALGAQPTNPSDPYPYVFLMQEFMGTMSEAPFTQPSVFNYFSPEYIVPQTTANSPEFGLETTGTIEPRQSVANAFAHNAATGLLIDLGATSPLGQQAASPGQLADYLGMLFMHSQMPTDMRSALINAISAIPQTDLPSRVEIAVYLVVTSSQYKIMH